MTLDLCPSCNESIGISVAWCADCAAWFRAVKEEVCTVDPTYVATGEGDYDPASETVLRRAFADQCKAKRPQQHRDNEGRYDFDGRLERLCVCGCTLGVHAAAAPHDCLAHSMPREPIYKDCHCPKFRQSRRRMEVPNG